MERNLVFGNMNKKNNWIFAYVRALYIVIAGYSKKIQIIKLLIINNIYSNLFEFK